MVESERAKLKLLFDSEASLRGESIVTFGEIVTEKIKFALKTYCKGCGGKLNAFFAVLSTKPIFILFFSLPFFQKKIKFHFFSLLLPSVLRLNNEYKLTFLIDSFQKSTSSNSMWRSSCPKTGSSKTSMIF